MIKILFFNNKSSSHSMLMKKHLLFITLHDLFLNQDKRNNFKKSRNGFYMNFIHYFFHKTLVCCIFLLIHNLNGVALISLGYDCTIAGTLRSLHLRKAAYPFDWMYSDFNALYNAIADDFQHFLDPSTLRVGDDNRTIIDYYGLSFVHDFPTIHDNVAMNDSELHPWAKIRDDWQQFIEPMREKYLRRIDRLINDLMGTEPIFLIRYEMKKNESIRLRELLIHRYPHLNFTLVAINTSHEAKLDWGLDKIKNFHVRGHPSKFLSDWKEIFNNPGFHFTSVRDSMEIQDKDMFMCTGNCMGK